MSEDKERTLIQTRPEAKGHGFKMKERALLVQVSAQSLGKVHVLDRMVNLIGRGQDCQIQVRDDEISMVHCSIHVDTTGTMMIEDEGSSNGTLVNGKKLKRPKALNFGDRIVMGKTIFRFLREESL